VLPIAARFAAATAEVGPLPCANWCLLKRLRFRGITVLETSKATRAQPQWLAILCLMLYEDWTFWEAEVRLAEHRELRQVLRPTSVPDFTTLRHRPSRKPP
jgi:hypothetical protein